MSASSWDTCPQCLLRAAQAKEAKRQEAEVAYGKVSREKYAQLVQEAKGEPAVGESLREDYEVGVGRDGEFFVLYSCECQQCGFAHEFKHTEMLNLTAKENP